MHLISFDGSLEIYRAAIGTFNSIIILCCENREVLKHSCILIKLKICLMCCFIVYVLFLILLLCGDVEVNPGSLCNLTFNLGHINARSLNVEDKFDEISSIVIGNQLDVFAVSETWLKPSIPSDALCIPGFSPMFRLDRKDGRRAGGVALYVSSNLASKICQDLEHTDFELLFVEIKVNSFTFICGVCYRPPSNKFSTQ
jgi:hypothetical protein